MIEKNIVSVRERISKVCERLGRDPALITVVAVSKGRSFLQVKEAVDRGITEIGENRIQEASGKYNDFKKDRAMLDMRVKWHMVGHLQTNKAHEAVEMFDLIHSVDSLRLAAVIDKEAAKRDKVQEILIQVNTSSESTKFGVDPDALIPIAREIASLKNVRVRGMMTIAPVVDVPEMTRPFFSMLRELNERLQKEVFTGFPLTVLSMGMSDDFETAIEEGATMLRLGRAIFGE